MERLNQAESSLRAFDIDEFASEVDVLLSLTLQREYALDVDTRRSLWSAAMGLYVAAVGQL
jgi:hypothetical protein